MLGTEDIILILIVFVVLFGADKLPELARSLGKATGEFKRAQIKAQIENKIEPRRSDKDKDANNDKDTNEDIDKNVKINNLALDIGIDIEGKSSDQLIEEIRLKIRIGKMGIQKIQK